MGSLIYSISSASAAFYGVNVLEENPPANVRGAGTNIVAVVGNFPWGPVLTPTEITSAAELFAAFCPTPFGAQDSYVAMRAFLNKTFPNTLLAVRVDNTGGTAAAHTFNDGAGSPAASVDVTARHQGVLGNSVKVAWTTNADDATARDATVTIGTTYSATYKQVAKIVSAALVVTDPGDPYVIFAKHSAATLVPAVISATALTAGANGTPVAGDYDDAIATLSSASVDFDVAFVAEPESALIDDVNDSVKSFVDSYAKGFWVLATPAAQTISTAKTYRADYASERTLYPWPLVKTTDGYDPNRAEITVQGNSFAAAAIASVPPEVSPGGAPGAPFLRGITGLEQDATPTELNSANDSGVTPFFMSDALEGAILHNAVTTSLASGRTKVFRRRMTDYIEQSLAAYLEHFVGQPLDLDLTNRSLGPVTAPEVAGLRQFLEDLKTNQRIRDYSLDPFSANVQSDIDAGRWILAVAVQLVSAQEKIILKATIGETVSVSSNP